MKITFCEFPAGAVLVKSRTDDEADEALARHAAMQKCPECDEQTRHYTDDAGGHEYWCCGGHGLIGVVCDPINVAKSITHHGIVHNKSRSAGWRRRNFR